MFKFLLFLCFLNVIFNTYNGTLRDDIKVLMSDFNREAKDSHLYKQIKYRVRRFVEVLDPCEKRRASLRKRMRQAESEVKEYLSKKKNVIHPEISFFIPVYNRAKVVRTAIDSIYSQNLEMPFEVIVVDDASTDQTYKVLKEYERKYDNFFVYRHKINKKAPATRNTAILHARGDYLFNLDSDDILLPGSVKKLYEGMKKHNLEHSFFGKYQFFHDYDSKKLWLSTDLKLPCVYTIFEAVHNDNKMNLPISIGCRLISKKSWERVGGYLEDGGHDNWAFSFMQLASGMPAYVLPEAGYLHRTWTNSDCYTCKVCAKKWDESPLKALKLFEEVLGKRITKYLKTRHSNGDFMCSYATRYGIDLIDYDNLKLYYQGICLFEDEKYDQATEIFLKTIENGFKHVKVYLKLLRSATFAGQFDKALFALTKLKH